MTLLNSVCNSLYVQERKKRRVCVRTKQDIQQAKRTTQQKKKSK